MAEIHNLPDAASADGKMNDAFQLAPQPINRIVKTAGVCDGKPRVANTRIPVWILLGYKSNKEQLSDSQILALFPDLTLEDLNAAWEYARTNPSECKAATH